MPPETHRWLVWLCGLSALGCSPTAFVQADLPAGVDWLALVELDGDGSASRVSQFGRVEKFAAVLDSVELSDRSWLVGYGDGQLAAFPRPIDELPFRGARGCEPTLPRPAYFAHVQRENRSTPVAEGGRVEDAPRLTADELAGVCSHTATTVFVEPLCANIACPAEFVDGPGGCWRTTNLGRNCGGAQVKTAVFPDGRWCVESDELVQDFPEAAATGAVTVGSPSCDSGAFRVSFPPANALPIDELRLYPESWISEFVPRWSGGLNDPETGFAFSLTRSGGNLFASYKQVTQTDLGDARTCTRRYAEDFALKPRERLPTTRLSVVDPERLDVLRTASAPPCLQALLPDADGGILGLSASEVEINGANNARWQLTRIDRSLRVIQVAPLNYRAPEGLVPATVLSEPRGLERVGDRLIAAIGDVDPNNPADHSKTRLIAYDATTLAYRTETMLDLHEARIAGVDETTVLFGGRADVGANPQLSWLRVEDWRELERASYKLEPSPGNGPITALLPSSDPQLSTWMLTGVQRPALVFIAPRWPGGPLTDRLGLFDRPVVPLAVSVLPRDRMLISATMSAAESADPVMFFYVVDSQHRRLLGPGQPSAGLPNLPLASVSDGQGDVFVLTNWRPSIVRVRAP